MYKEQLQERKHEQVKDDYGYQLWAFKTMKIIRSRDVIFNEKVMYKE